MITEDKDFGQLVYAGSATATGVVLLRFPGGQRGQMVQSVVDLVQNHSTRLIGAYVVLQPGRVRLTTLP